MAIAPHASAASPGWLSSWAAPGSVYVNSDISSGKKKRSSGSTTPGRTSPQLACQGRKDPQPAPSLESGDQCRFSLRMGMLHFMPDVTYFNAKKSSPCFYRPPTTRPSGLAFHPLRVRSHCCSFSRRKHGEKEWDAPPDAPGKPTDSGRNRTQTDSVLKTESVFAGSRTRETTWPTCKSGSHHPGWGSEDW